MDQDLIANPVTTLVCSKCGHELDVAGKPAFSSVVCHQCQTSLTVPVMLGAFLLLERMGAGGMGAVYRALDTALNRFVAIKVMKAALGEDAKLVQSFIREAQSAAALNHRNIVQIYACGQEKGQPYIVMELVTGGKMSQLFTREKPMAEAKLLKIALDVAEGLSAANAVGLVHGDIKPENILMDAAGTAKIVDFGLAQFVNAQKERGEIWGTPYYISPERARGHKADHRSDIYSLGATMFHALAGTPPFDGPTPVDVVLARLKNPLPSLADLCGGLQPSTIELIERMMASDPSLRYPTSASLKSDMQTALEDAREAAKNRARPAPRKKNMISPVIAGVAVVVALVVGGIFLTRVREAQEQAASAPARPEKSAPAAPVEPVVPAEEVTVSREEVAGPDGIVRQRTIITIFRDDEIVRLVEAAQLASGPQPLEGLKQYVAFAKNLPDGSVRQRWVVLLEAIPAWRGNERDKANSYLDWCSKQKIDTARADHPVNMPQMLAGYLTGAIKVRAFESYARQQPGWFTGLRDLMEGVRQVTIGEVDKAREPLDAFLVRPDDDPGWIAAYRPLAERLRDVIREVDDARSEVEVHLKSGQPARARSTIEGARARIPAALARGLDGFDSRIEALEREQKESERAVVERARREIVQQDLDRVDQVMAGVSALIMRQRDFSRALITINDPLSQLQTLEGREAAAVAKEQIAALDAMKKFMISSPRQVPFKREQGCDLGGDLIEATPLGARVTLDYRAVTTHKWDEMPLRSFVRIADFYVNQTSLDPAERGNALAGLAVYSLLNGAIEPAQKYAKMAIELDASRAAAVRRLLPGLLP